jgi:MFS family permease
MQFNESLMPLIALLTLFFTGFNLLEATLPSLVSKTAPADLRGTAMGAYSTCQFLGAGLGGSIGGWCYGHYGASAVFLLCALLAFSWLVFALFMKQPRYWANLLIDLANIPLKKRKQFITAMLAVKGVEEITSHEEEAVAYLKVDNSILNKQALQAIISQYS